MPKYLSLFKYTAEGTKGFLKEKAAAREAAARKAFESVGGTVEMFYWGRRANTLVLRLRNCLMPPPRRPLWHS
jgi:uncharacterized protein with GYD domain